MKQSKKLLSIFLAVLMLLGTVSVIGNAGYQKAQMGYDSVDNPAPTADQVANLILDVLDELLYEMDFNENYVVVKINLTSVDNALDTLYGFNGIKTLAGGDIAKLDLSAVKDKTRANTGDMGILYVLLEFLSDNADTLSKAAYGIGTDNGLQLGWLIDLIGLDLGDVGDLLADIPGFLVKTVYDMLIQSLRLLVLLFLQRLTHLTKSLTQLSQTFLQSHKSIKTFLLVSMMKKVTQSQQRFGMKAHTFLLLTKLQVKT